MIILQLKLIVITIHAFIINTYLKLESLLEFQLVPELKQLFVNLKSLLQ